MKILRYRIGSAVLQLGMRILPPSRARSELYQLIDLWGTHVRVAVERHRKGEEI